MDLSSFEINANIYVGKEFNNFQQSYRSISDEISSTN